MRLSLCNFVRLKSVLFPVCPSTGGGTIKPRRKCVRLAYKGCANRPFYHIIVTNRWKHRDVQPYEQLGTYDPMPNQDNQKLLSLNLDRTRYWVGRGALFTKPLQHLLGYIGFFPIHPRSIEHVWRRRDAEKVEKEKQAAS